MVNGASPAAAAFAATLVVAARTFGVLLFAPSAVHQALRFEDFRRAIAGYGLVPARAQRIAALAIIGGEAAAAAMLAAGPFARPGALLAIAMLAMFAGAMALVLRRGGEIDCGCFFGGGGGARVDRRLVARNLLFAAILAPAALRSLPAGIVDAAVLVDGVGFAVACLLLGELLGQLVKVRHARTLSLGWRA